MFTYFIQGYDPFAASKKLPYSNTFCSYLMNNSSCNFNHIIDHLLTFSQHLYDAFTNPLLVSNLVGPIDFANGSSNQRCFCWNTGDGLYSIQSGCDSQTFAQDTPYSQVTLTLFHNSSLMLRSKCCFSTQILSRKSIKL